MARSFVQPVIPASGYDIVRIVLGLVLILAAGLKAHQVAVVAVPENSGIGAGWAALAIAECELGFGFWLLAGPAPRATRRAAIGCFVLFGCVALIRGLSGADSCGCFGKVRISPWWTFVGDLVAIAALLRWRPAQAARSGIEGKKPFGRLGQLHAAGMGLLFLAAGLTGGWAMLTGSPARPSADGEIPVDGQVVLLEPETWLGRRFPLLKYVDIGDELKTDRWTVILYHHDCARCQALVAELETTASFSTPRGAQSRLALIEIPPFESGTRGTEPEGTAIRHGRLAAKNEWFVTTPVRLQLAEGIVTLVSPNDADS